MTYTTENERLKHIRKDLLGLSQAELAKKIGMTQGGYSDTERGRYQVSVNILTKLNNLFSVNMDYIKTGKGSPFIKAEKTADAETMSLMPSVKKRIRYFDFHRDFDLGNNNKAEDIVIPGFEDCEIAINVWGENMEPDFYSGEIILLKFWEENFVEFGQTYLITTKKKHRMLKKIFPGKKDFFLCESTNSKYAGVEIKKSDIDSLHIVKGKISRRLI